MELKKDVSYTWREDQQYVTFPAYDETKKYGNIIVDDLHERPCSRCNKQTIHIVDEYNNVACLQCVADGYEDLTAWRDHDGIRQGFRAYDEIVRQDKNVGRLTLGTSFRMTTHTFVEHILKPRDPEGKLGRIYPINEWHVDLSRNLLCFDAESDVGPTFQLLEALLDLPTDLQLVRISWSDEYIFFYCIPLTGAAATAFCHDIPEGMEWPYDDHTHVTNYAGVARTRLGDTPRWSVDAYKRALRPKL